MAEEFLDGVSCSVNCKERFQQKIREREKKERDLFIQKQRREARKREKELEREREIALEQPDNKRRRIEAGEKSEQQKKAMSKLPLKKVRNDFFLYV